MNVQRCDFVVDGLDDQGKPSGRFLEVRRVALVDEQGKLIGEYGDPDAVLAVIQGASGKLRLVAVETVGEPRTDLTGRFVCDEQGLD